MFNRGTLGAGVSGGPGGPAPTASGESSRGGFVETSKYKNKADATEAGVRTSSANSDLTATAQNPPPGTGPGSPPSSGAGAGGTPPPFDFSNGGQISGSSTATNTVVGVKTLKRVDEASGDHKEYGVVVRGSLAGQGIDPSMLMTAGGSGSVSGGTFSSRSDWRSGTKYDEWTAGGASGSVTGYANGNLTVTADAAWAGGYSLDTSNKETYSGDEVTYGMSATGSVSVWPNPSGTGDFTFFRREIEGSGESEQGYNGAGALTRGTTARGGKLVTTTSTSDMAGGYKVTESSKRLSSW